ncbi:hypothetical protein BV22DRAFT_1027224 [Leucogyrophana mollusca]|uniref:Uncharacterized protein n=1 Tax=Leucogyrophana mollusca TaxID=85980 RepID=A0ACB8ATP8_9AGAM|nr:hypothetical protein BV22DRAFT_1027224 [Leucogyrophana mollusca]
MLVVDIMHECELGTWKSLFTHLIRLLYAISPAGQLVAELNSRFRQIPTFGRGVIRKFHNNASEMRRLAARDYEDLLQCSIPAFDGLLPEPHNKRVLTLLYRFAEWHALAKLRMHTDSSLAILQDVTSKFCKELRRFRDETCSAFQTVELPKEQDARRRRKKGPAAGTASQPSTSQSTRKAKSFNMTTYKIHAIGDYVRTIHEYGTTDSYTTQIVRLFLQSHFRQLLT